MRCRSSRWPPTTDLVLASLCVACCPGRRWSNKTLPSSDMTPCGSWTLSELLASLKPPGSPACCYPPNSSFSLSTSNLPDLLSLSTSDLPDLPLEADSGLERCEMVG